MKRLSTINKVLNRIFTLTVFSLLSLTRSGWSQVPVIKIIQPYENARIPAVESSFVFGSVEPATATLLINGVVVQPHKNGGFFTMIPFKSGAFKIEAIATDGVDVASATRTVSVEEAMATFDVESGRIEPISPTSSVVLRPGDLLSVSMQAAPNSNATFKIGSETTLLPFIEQPGSVKGIYKGVYKIQPQDNFDNDELIYMVKRPDGKKLIKKSGVHLTVQRRTLPRYVELIDDGILLTGPGTNFGYHLFPLKGTRFEVTGEWGDFFRAGAGNSLSGWIKKSSVSELPPGTNAPRSTAYNIRINATDSSTLIEIPLQYHHLHRVEQFVDPNRYELTLWGVTADADRIRYKSKTSVVKEMIWRQPEPDVFVLEVQTTQKYPWGYDVRYEGNTLIFEIRHRPMVGLGRNQSLKGLKVVLDPGHSESSFGTIGPKGNTEASVVHAAALVVKKRLEKDGAEVFITREAGKEMGLKTRTDLAWQEKGNLFISLHCDATPEGQDPRPIQGFSVHYYSPQSRPLAEEIQRIYGQKTAIPDQGLWRSNLSVCRTTQMPAVLFELAFLVLPEYEELLLTPSYQQTLAETISAAVTAYVGASR